MPKKLISILMPTYNEAGNIEEILNRAKRSLDKIGEGYEILVIDDSSPDNTAGIAEKFLDNSGRVIRRKGKRGLSLSVLDGIKQAKGNIVVVMDADGSHPPELIPGFIEEMNNGNDLIIASRYCKGGTTQGFPLSRKAFSRLGCFMGGLVTDIKDNTSGFFAVKKSALEGVKLAPRGFKIGLEIFVKAKFLKSKEVPYTFVNRKKGKSKFGIKASAQYAFQVLSLSAYRLFKKRRC